MVLIGRKIRSSSPWDFVELSKVTTGLGHDYIVKCPKDAIDRNPEEYSPDIIVIYKESSRSILDFPDIIDSIYLLFYIFPVRCYFYRLLILLHTWHVLH